MNKTKRHLLLVMLVLAVLAIPTAIVFAKELGQLNIGGPGINGTLTLTDPKYMMNLEQSGFFDQAALTKVPENLNIDAGYTINAKLNLDGKLVPFVEMVYYPTTEGEPSYVHYTGRLEGQTLKPADIWSKLSLSADNAFRTLMAANQVTLQSALIVATVKEQAPAEAPAAAQPMTAPVASPKTAQPPVWILVVSAMIVLLVGAGVVIRRRTVSPTS
jgi:hypothetical protein